ncbi:hypothetical protein VA7868_04609 [Vibrio aerogenes CECT 7868]|uniref:Uncharacterized protein n=1 Tax=Vibrio aerogenes CECT 7868 TaxID=1216006 RepID=A0A1M6FAJ1_9VIBR|nr:hypothetical protein [Vibrio aerogenes]SHI94700.1 hypothetical protein VA7868_04609 [Vibrio aerogenes CECT 7868]
MSFLDDLGNFGSGLLDSVGEGFDNLVDAATKPTQSVNSKTAPQTMQQADDNGNAVTASQVQPNTDKTLLYVGGGVGVCLILGIIVLAVKK